MRRMLILFGREALAYLRSPAYWIMLAAAWALAGLMMRYTVLPSTRGDLPLMLSGSANLWFWIQVLLVPLLTMRLLSDEKRSGSFEMLVTAPVNDVEIVVGKYLAVVLALMIAALPVIGWQALTLLVGGEPDPGAVLSAYLGQVSTGAVFAAVALSCSATTQHQLLAGFVGLIAVLVLCFLPQVPFPESMAGVADFVQSGSLAGHSREAAVGLLDLRNVSYHLALIFFFLLLSVRILEVRKWR